MVDGDGSLARKTEGLWTVFLCGSEPCVRAFAAWAARICGTTAKPYYRTGCWYISMSGRYQVPKLVRALYAQAPVSLDRKQETAAIGFSRPENPDVSQAHRARSPRNRKSARTTASWAASASAATWRRNGVRPTLAGRLEVDGHVRRRESHARSGLAAARSFHLNDEGLVARFTWTSKPSLNRTCAPVMSG